MELEQRINLLRLLGKYMRSEDAVFKEIKNKAHNLNPWFIPEFINMAINNIANEFLEQDKLTEWIKKYRVKPIAPVKSVGIVMAGNIPLVGFHDLLCVIMSGHAAVIKPSAA